MARGGRRSGKPGGNYAQRSDLRKPPTKALGHSQTYGENADLTRKLQAVPINTPGQPSPAPTTAPVGGGGQGPAPKLSDIAGKFGDLFAPTDRPDEHLFTGMGQPAFTPPPPLTQAVAALNTVPDLPELRAVRAQLSAAQSNLAAP